MGLSARYSLATAMAAVLAVSTLSRAGISISDDFSLSANSADARYAGKTLNGTTTVEGGATWSSNSSLVFGGSGGSGYIATTPGSVAAKVAASPTVNDPVLTISANLKHFYDGTGKGADGTSGAWLAIGFGSSSSGTDNTYSGGVFVLLHTGGQVSLLTNNGSTATLANKTSIDISQAHTITLEYNKTANSVKAMIDGTVIGVGTYNLSFTPTINYAGFSSYNAKSGGSFDNFSLTTVPEPAAIGVLGIGGLLLTKRMR